MKSRSKLLKSVEAELANSFKAFEKVRKGEPPKRAPSLVSTLRRVSDIVEGWGMHYWFCNNGMCFISRSTFQAAYLSVSFWKKERILSALRCKEYIDDFAFALKSA